MAGDATAWPWPHRPVGRSLITAAIALLAGPALLLDAAAPAVAGGLVAWHALSTAVLAGLALWALWTPQLPRATGRALARGLGLLLLAALAVAAQRTPGVDAASATTGLAAVLTAAGWLFYVGSRWARQEITW